jgi:hypothetical protein
MKILSRIDSTLFTLLSLILLAVVAISGMANLQTDAELVIACPPDWDAMLQLVRFDVNRYVIPLAPFSVLGLRGMFINFLKI